MKRVLTVAIALLLCLSIALPLGANAAIFNSPKAESLMALEAMIEGVDEAVTDCVIVTTVEEAKNGNPDITADEKDALIAAYEGLNDGSAKLPVEGEYAVREIVSVNYKNAGCRQVHDHGEAAKLTIKFNLGVEAGANVAVFTCVDGEWAAVETVNNGDGTVTAVSMDLGPVAFAILG